MYEPQVEEEMDPQSSGTVSHNMENRLHVISRRVKRLVFLLTAAEDYVC